MAVSLALHAQPAALDTLTGRTAAASPVVVTLRDGHAQRFVTGSTPVHCADGLSFAAPSIRGAATEQRGRLGGAGSRNIPYPDGEPGVAAHATLRGSLRSRRTAVGTITYSVDVHGAGRTVTHCLAGPVRFTASP